MTTTTDFDMQVWVGCLACYNDGKLHGEWMPAADANDWQCALSTHEEMWIFDTENMPRREEMSPSTAVKWAELIEGAEFYSAEEYEAFVAWLDNAGISDPESVSIDDFRGAFCGIWASEKDYAQQFAEDIGAINEDAAWPNSYIDWDAATEDLFNDLWSHDMSGGRVAVFQYV